MVLITSTNCRVAELWLKGTSLVEKQVADRLQPFLRWSVPNEPGSLRVVGKNHGKEAARFELATVGTAHHLEVHPDRSTLRADGADLVSIEIRVVDAAGHRVPDAAQPIELQVAGAGSPVAVDSADLRAIGSVQSNRRIPYDGQILAIVRAGTDAGTVVVSGRSAQARGEIKLTVR
jgi:beta-galactosidase